MSKDIEKTKSNLPDKQTSITDSEGNTYKDGGLVVSDDGRFFVLRFKYNNKKDKNQCTSIEYK
jgi:hypothetical protein